MDNEIQKNYDLYSEKLTEWCYFKKINTVFCWTSIINSDPTPNKNNIPWIIERLLNEEISFSDVEYSYIYNILYLYENKKHIIPMDKRNIYSYNNFKDFYDMLYDMFFIDMEKILQEKYKLKAHRESKIWCNKNITYEKDFDFLVYQYKKNFSGNLMVISPLTQFSLKWWTKGTNWRLLQSQLNNKNLDDEIKNIYIVIMPSNIKYLYIHGKGLFDERDNQISMYTIEKKWNYFSMFLKYLGAINYIPKQYINDDYIDTFINNNGIALQHLKPNEINSKRILMAIRSNIQSATFITDKYFSDISFLKNISKEKNILKYIRHQFKTPNLCENVFMNDKNCFEFIPDYIKTKKMCKDAVNYNYKNILYVPENMITFFMAKHVFDCDSDFFKEHLSNHEIFNIISVSKNTILNVCSRLNGSVFNKNKS